MVLLLVGCSDEPAAVSFIAVTFNTGTTEAMGEEDPPVGGYSEQHAAYSDEHYGDGLAWVPAVEATRDFFARIDADVVVFQEIFYSPECAEIPEEAREDFVCETWTEGDPTVALEVLGAGWQVMCHPGKSDKCAAVNRRFGSFRGCDEDFCLEGMEGYRVEDCGSGVRVGRAVIELASGGTLTLVSYHGTSGITPDEQDCRVQQVDQVFVDLGDGEPGANGETNLVMGDLNTDPGRGSDYDPSAARWTDFVGEERDFHFVSDVGFDAPGSYAGLFDIDHVVSDSATGSCWIAGVTEGHPLVIEDRYFDHRPVVCPVQMPAQ